EVDDAVLRHAEEPARHLVERHHGAVRLDQLVEDFLQDVLRVARIRHARADEVAQPAALPRDSLRDPLVLLAQNGLHAWVKTNGKGQYLIYDLPPCRSRAPFFSKPHAVSGWPSSSASAGSPGAR